jgi:hypothetical protein
MGIRLTEKAQKEVEEGFALDKEAWQLLDLIVAEWSTDPMSVQCFDLRIVERAKHVVSRRKEIDAKAGLYGSGAFR